MHERVKSSVLVDAVFLFTRFGDFDFDTASIINSQKMNTNAYTRFYSINDESSLMMIKRQQHGTERRIYGLPYIP